MITYSNIGHFGRLGNQLFQFASTYGIAKKIGSEVAFPIENTVQSVEEHFKDGITRHITFDVPKYFCLDDSILRKKEDIVTKYVYNEPHFHFTEQAFLIQDSCDLLGYYQSEKYFEHCEKDLRRILTFNKDILSICSSIYTNAVLTKAQSCNTTSIHVRVGDYVGLQQFHPILQADYYQSAIDILYSDTDLFLVFSDDINYCKQIFPEHHKICYIEEGSDIEQLCLMSMCKNNIIGNSSYSWWAAWLNPNPGVIIAPKNWFGPAYQFTHDTKDVYCKNWKVI